VEIPALQDRDEGSRGWGFPDGTAAHERVIFVGLDPNVPYELGQEVRRAVATWQRGLNAHGANVRLVVVPDSNRPDRSVDDYNPDYRLHIRVDDPRYDRSQGHDPVEDDADADYETLFVDGAGRTRVAVIRINGAGIRSIYTRDAKGRVRSYKGPMTLNRALRLAPDFFEPIVSHELGHAFGNGDYKPKPGTADCSIMAERLTTADNFAAKPTELDFKSAVKHMNESAGTVPKQLPAPPSRKNYR
jgi:hypothetical protein